MDFVIPIFGNTIRTERPHLVVEIILKRNRNATNLTIEVLLLRDFWVHTRAYERLAWYTSSHRVVSILFMHLMPAACCYFLCKIPK